MSARSARSSTTRRSASSSYARMVGLAAFKWHGDVSRRAQEDVSREPEPHPHDHARVARGHDDQRADGRAGAARRAAAVIIDEVHAFAADDRGAHLAALLERIVQLVGRDVQRIGLSATVGNPRVIGQWMQGSSERPFRLVDPPRPQADRDVTHRLLRRRRRRGERGRDSSGAARRAWSSSRAARAPRRSRTRSAAAASRCSSTTAR